jgi:uncharacterized protein (TIRG00374 family)
LIAIGYVLIKLDWNATIGIFTNLKWLWLMMAFGIYFVNYILRTIRFRFLLELKTTSFIQLLGITNLYGMYLYLMPAKSGELSYPLLLKSRLKVPLTTSTALLIVVRFFDFATIALFLPVILIVFWVQFPSWVKLSAILFCCLIYGFGICSIVYLRKPVRTYYENEPDLAPRVAFFSKIRSSFQKLIQNLRLIDQKKQYWKLWLVTIGIWLCIQLNLYLIILSLGHKLTLFQIAVVSIIMVPLTLFPFQGFANLGTHEFGWTVAFALFGQSEKNALNIAFSSHIILLLFVLLLGIIGSTLIHVNKPSEKFFR